MSPFRRTLRQTLTIARRDFVATVFTPIFLLFLFAPVIMGSFAGIGGLGAASVADGGRERSRIVAVVPDRLARPIAEADTRLRGVFRPGEGPPDLVTIAPVATGVAQARDAFQARGYDTAAVLFGPLDAPHILYGARGDRAADYLATLAQATLMAQALGGALPRVAAIKVPIAHARPSHGARNQSAFFAVFGIFFLTLFLAGQVVGTMAEERNNKVIEILAAAVPLESVFLGKLLGMFGVAVLFVVFWATVVGQIGALMPPPLHAALGELSPAVGAPAFTLLFIGYFTAAYLLLGSVFLAVGAQATTPREIQMLSLPITILQVAMFALASAAVHSPGTWIATFAEVFPLSSPFAMAGHAANTPGLWRHGAAIAWQLMWVAIFVFVGARMFRRGVLQSGSANPRWRRAKSN